MYLRQIKRPQGIYLAIREGYYDSTKKQGKSACLTINMAEKMEVSTDDIRNVGYCVLKQLYKSLEIDKFWNWKTRNLSIEFSVDKILRLLVFSRILLPASKKGTYDRRDFYFEDFGDFSIYDIHHALDIICANNEALQKWIFNHSEKNMLQRYVRLLL